MKVLFAGGGTGGHLYPALAVAEYMRKTDPEFVGVFMGSAQGLEAEVVPQRGYPFVPIPGSGFRRLGFVRRVQFLWNLLRGVCVSLGWVWREKPDVVVVTGGYASLAAGLASALLRRPLIVQEQNSIPGLANRLLGRVAREVHVAFPGCERFFPRAGQVVLTGNPLREEILEPPETSVERSAPAVLVLGGSRGARSLNHAVLHAIPLVAESIEGVGWLWQTGALDHAQLVRSLGSVVGVSIHPFLDEIRTAYACADLVVCRAGAMTLSEISALGKAAILVPFPGAVDDHQTENARRLVEAGAAVLLPDAQLSGPRLAQEIVDLLRDPDRRARMGRSSAEFARPHATAELAAAVRRQARGRPLEVALVRASQ